MRGPILKMRVQAQNPVQYRLILGNQELAVNPALGQHVHLRWTGTLFCVHCGHKMRKSFDQGYCWDCFSTLAQCDQCIMKPELCHHHLGTCREPSWGQNYCMSPHIIYLSNSSGLKVGITRLSQKTTRWIDQGAVQGIPLAVVATRLKSGQAEAFFRDTIGVKDRTQWQKMLKGSPELLDLDQLRQDALKQWPVEMEVMEFSSEAMTEIVYPILQYPTKVTSLNLEKSPEIAGQLLGIKGQYWILDTGVINMRKYQGYELEVIKWV